MCGSWGAGGTPLAWRLPTQGPHQCPYCQLLFLGPGGVFADPRPPYRAEQGGDCVSERPQHGADRGPGICPQRGSTPLPPRRLLSNLPGPVRSAGGHAPPPRLNGSGWRDLKLGVTLPGQGRGCGRATKRPHCTWGAPCRARPGCTEGRQ